MLTLTQTFLLPEKHICYLLEIIQRFCLPVVKSYVSDRSYPDLIILIFVFHSLVTSCHLQWRMLFFVASLFLFLKMYLIENCILFWLILWHFPISCVSGALLLIRFVDWLILAVIGETESSSSRYCQIFSHFLPNLSVINL